MSTYALTNEVENGSRSHDLVVEDFRILRMLPSDTASKEDRALLLTLGLVGETGTDVFSATNFHNFVTEKVSKSVG